MPKCAKFSLRNLEFNVGGVTSFRPTIGIYTLTTLTPSSAGGTNHIDNRSLLCQPCNTKKSDKMSLIELRRQNDREGYTQPNEPIDLKAALPWTKNLFNGNYGTDYTGKA